MRAFTRDFGRLSFALVATLTLSACVNAGDSELGHEDPKAPGEVLGFYTLSGKLSDDSCGAESLNAPSEWSFEVKLSRDGSTLYWLNGREGIVGTIDKAGSFSFATHLDLPLAQARGSVIGCTIVRTDSAAGELASSEESLSMKLTYGYTAKAGSDCAEFTTGTDGMPQVLPCAMTYTLHGERVASE
jgi:hypothetical protein